ncbi:MAG: transposase [Blautia producta]
MANDNHLLSVPCYNETMQKQDYYNEFFELGQQKINFSFFELSLPDDDPVYTLKKVMEDLDFPGLLANCSDKGRIGFNPIMMYAVVTYANMRGVRAVNRIVELCERDLAFIWLTKGQTSLWQSHIKSQTSENYIRKPAKK